MRRMRGAGAPWGLAAIQVHPRPSPMDVAPLCPELGNDPAKQWEHWEVPQSMLAPFFICKCHQFWSYLPRVSAGQRQQSSVSCAARLLWPTEGSAPGDVLPFRTVVVLSTTNSDSLQYQ